ncbi:MAG: hypothetical protein KF901_15030 [Myxococcales bacterium]|nr:hypothetical protein [Myxococcales bacterium]
MYRRMTPLFPTAQMFELEEPYTALSCVGPSAEVRFENVRYAMPPEAANTPGTAFVYADRIRSVVGRHETTHLRGRPGARVSSPELRRAKLASVRGARAVLYEKRQQLLELG